MLPSELLSWSAGNPRRGHRPGLRSHGLRSHCQHGRAEQRGRRNDGHRPATAPRCSQSTQAPAAQGRPSPGARHDGPNRSTLKTGHPEKEAAPTPLSPLPHTSSCGSSFPAKSGEGQKSLPPRRGGEGTERLPVTPGGKGQRDRDGARATEVPPWESLASPAPRPHCTRGQGAEPRGAGPGARRAARRQEVTVTHRAS